ncbi:MAG: hypothetical protein LC745_06940 [Planctomycetia bacterium]|nr:hypothetical protein [Planctomycetia bacterium]
MECLEERQLLAYSPLGTSLPQFAITGFASPAASWGGPLTVTVDISNVGSSTILEPLALAPGSVSSADAAASVVGVFASNNPQFRGAVEVGTVDVPALAQNSFQRLTQTITLPNRPTGFPGDGGRIYIAFETNATNTVFQANTTHNVSKPVRVAIEAPLPELRTVGLDLPPVMQPGDTVQPNIRITNIGTADTNLQGPVQVALVASTTRSFTSGSSIVGLYTVDNVPSISQTSTRGLALGDANQTPPANVVTVTGSIVTLPATPRTYYLGVVIDPSNQLKELSKVPASTRNQTRFELIRRVGPPIRNLPPAGVLVNGGPTLVPAFPNPFNNQPVGGPVGGSFPAAGSGTVINTQPFPPLVPIQRSKV